MMNNKKLIAREAVILVAAAIVLGLTSAAAGADPTSTIMSGAAVGGDGQPARAVGGLDGSKIAFTKICAVSLPPAGCPMSVELHGAEIWTMNGDGSDPTQLTQNDTWDLAPVWSPDGNTIAFFGVQFNSADQATGPPQIYLINTSTRLQSELTSNGADAIPVVGRFPSFSPDGTKIAFDNGGGPSSNIFVTNADGSGTPTRLTTDPKPERNIRPAWSPDGLKIAFVSRRTGCDDIYVMNVDRSEITQLTGTPQCDPSSVPKPPADNAPAWSPDGKRIVFQRTLSDGNTDIYTMNAADGSEQTRLTDWPGADQDPDWSPNGRWIAFHRVIQPIDAQIVEVYVMNADGSNQIPLTHLPSENAHPGWRPAQAP